MGFLVTLLAGPVAFIVLVSSDVCRCACRSPAQFYLTRLILVSRRRPTGRWCVPPNWRTVMHLDTAKACRTFTEKSFVDPTSGVESPFQSLHEQPNPSKCA